MVSQLLILCLTLTLPLLLLIFFKNRRILKNSSLPPGPKGLPILGNLHQLDSSILYLQLWQLSKKYGPLYSLKFGLRRAIVVSSAQLAKEVLKDHDLECCGRPKLLGQQTLFYNGLEVIFSTYGEFWREIRKICVVHVFSNRHVSRFASIRQHEVKNILKRISRNASSSKLTNLNEAMMAHTSSIICRIVFGRSYDDEGAERSRFHGLLNDCQAMMAAFYFSDYIPFLGWIDKLTRQQARLAGIFKEVDKFFQEVIDEHRDPNRKNTTENEDITDVILQLQKQRSTSVELTDDVVKAILMDMLLAATDTTAATLTWAMNSLLRDPRGMKKTQEEIRTLGGRKEFLDEDDIQQFPYLKAVIKETLRLHLPGPLLVQRETNETCSIGGYEIPAKTTVYVHAWAIHRDPEIWKDPFEFYPERFIDSSITFRGQDFEFIPFGAGRRICPGMSMAVASLKLTLANLLNAFDWELPPGMTTEDIDTEVLPGLTTHKKNSLCVLAKCVV